MLRRNNSSRLSSVYIVGDLDISIPTINGLCMFAAIVGPNSYRSDLRLDDGTTQLAY